MWCREMPVWIPSQQRGALPLLWRLFGVRVVQPGDLLVWDWERLGHPGWQKLTVTLQGCCPGSGGKGQPHHFLSLNPKLLFILIVLRKPEKEFSVFKAIRISVGMSRHKKAQTFSFIEASLQGQRTGPEHSFPGGDVGAWFIYHFRGFWMKHE